MSQFSIENVLSNAAKEIKPSGIRKFFDLLNEMKDVISLTVGQPDFITPWHIRAAGIESLEQGRTYYTSNSGMIELRREISKYLARRFDLHYHAEKEIVVTVGGSEAIDIALRALINPGDEVIIPEPCFVCYEPLTRLASGVPVIVTTREEDEFKLTPELLRAAITPKTKLLVLPFPNNPTGAIMTKNELEGIAAVLRDTNICVLSDEIYAELTYGGEGHTSIATLDDMRERTVVVSGFSKSHAMTGWRLGYLAAPEAFTAVMLKLHQFAIMCAPTTSQFAAIEAMANGDEDVRTMATEYDRRRKYILHRLRKMGLSCFEPRGAFYVYPRISDTGLTSEEFANRLIYEHRVAVVPGTAFGEGGEGFVRISYAYSLSHIEEAMNRMEKMVKPLLTK